MGLLSDVDSSTSIVLEAVNIEHSQVEGHRAVKIYPVKSMSSMKELAEFV